MSRCDRAVQVLKASKALETGVQGGAQIREKARAVRTTCIRNAEDLAVSSDHLVDVLRVPVPLVTL
ncbi:hypothetical protein ADL27_53485 [Streptomyces sp. NRRL F-6602]|nr:hypothetical protein ADL27_53485 [Streptomyces sp. NRRL F-6602]